MILDPEKFRNFELAGWQEIPTGYHDAFGPLTSQAIAPLLKAVRLKKGMSFLDIASGPGYVAAAAAKRGATVLGVDFSAAMVAHARRIHSGVEFREGDAEELPCGNGLFDAAAMNFGILHLGQPEKALLEAHRILRSRRQICFLGVGEAGGNHRLWHCLARRRTAWRTARRVARRAAVFSLQRSR